MALDATPRINARYLERFVQQPVRIVGKVISLRGELATLEADGSVTVHLNRVRRLSPFAFLPSQYLLFLFPCPGLSQHSLDQASLA